MYSIIKPTKKRIRGFIALQRRRSFSYPEVGATNDKLLPAGYAIDHNRIQLGHGREVFEQAKTAIRCWEMFNFNWVNLCWPNTPVEAEATVAILVRAFGVWSLNACRIIYTLAENGPVERFGFAYGTLPDHAERGEERFSVEWHHADDSVWYDILAFSRPHQLPAKIVYRYARQQQKRFAAASKQAMVKAVQ